MADHTHLGVVKSDSNDSFHNGSHNSIQKLTLFGELKDNERSHHSNSMVRSCQIKVNRIELSQDVIRSGKIPHSIVIAVTMSRVRRTLRTAPIEMTTHGEEAGKILLDLSLGFHYIHSLKSYDDLNTFRIMVQCIFKKKPRVQYVTLASTCIDLTQILQSGSFLDEIVLTPGEKEHIKTGEFSNQVGQAFATLYGTLWSYPKEIESPEDAEEWEMMDVPLSDNEDGIFLDSEEDEDEDVVFSGNANLTASVTSAFSTVSSVPTNPNPGITITQGGNVLLAQRLLSSKQVQETLVNEKKAAKKSKLQKLSSLITKNRKPNPNTDSDEGNIGPSTISEREEEENGPVREYDLGTSSSEGDSDEDEERTSPYVFTNRAESPTPIYQPFQPVHETPLTTVHPPHNAHNVTDNQGLPNTSILPTPPSPNNKAKMASHFPIQSNDLLSPFCGDNLPTHIILVNALTRRGRKLQEECFLQSTLPLPTSAPLPVPNSAGTSSAPSIPQPIQYTVICTKGPHEVQIVLSTIFSKYQQRSETLKIGIAGSDSYINDVLRPLVELLSKKSKGWVPALFYVIPIGKNNDIALHIASYDPIYKSYFFSGGWQESFSSNELFTEEQVEEIESKIRHYMEEEANNPYRFIIGEALLTYPGASGKSIPFLKGLHIGEDWDEVEKERNVFNIHDKISKEGGFNVENNNNNNNNNNNVNANAMPSELQVDYWIPKKKSEERQEVKLPLQYAAVTRLPAIAHALRIDPAHKPTASTLSLLLHFKDNKLGKGKKSTMLTRLGAAVGKEKKADKSDSGNNVLGTSITRLICSSMSDNGTFRVVIDGVEWPGIKYISVYPQWTTHVKTFPIQALTPAPLFSPNPISSTSSTSTSQSPTSPSPVLTPVTLPST